MISSKAYKYSIEVMPTFHSLHDPALTIKLSLYIYIYDLYI